MTFGFKEKLRIRTQIMILVGCIAVLAIGMLTAAYSVNIQLLEGVLKLQSLKLIEIENNNQLSIQLYRYEQKFRRILDQFTLKQAMLNRIYKFVELHQSDIIIDEPTYCPTTKDLNFKQSVFCMMCYNYSTYNFTSSRQFIDQQFLFVAMMQEVIQIMDPSQMIVQGIAYSPNITLPMMGAWPALDENILYNPHQRGWYLNHIKMMGSGDHSIFGEPFQTILNTYSMSITTNLTNAMNQFAGVVINLIKFEVLQQNFKKNYILINQKGQIMVGYFDYPENTTEPTSIYSESITGFNYDDWIQIQRQINQSNGISNCQIPSLPLYLCRYNSIYQQDVLMIIKYLTKPPLTMILFINASEIYSSVASLHDEISSKLTFEWKQYIFVITAEIILANVLFMIALMKILKPLNQLINYQSNKSNITKLNLSLFTQIRQFDMIYPNKNKDSTMNAIIWIFKRLIAKCNTRNKKCDEIEALNYPNWKKKLKKVDLSRLPGDSLSEF